MLRPELWRKVCRSNDMLCIGCVEDRLGRKLVPADFNLEDTHNLIKLWPPARRLKHRLGISWDKRLTGVLAVICAKVLAISSRFLSVTARLTRGLMASFARARKASPNYMVEPEGPVSADRSKNPKGQFEKPKPTPIETWRLPLRTTMRGP